MQEGDDLPEDTRSPAALPTYGAPFSVICGSVPKAVWSAGAGS